MQRAIALSLAVVVGAGGCHSLFGYASRGERGAADRQTREGVLDRSPGQDRPDGPGGDGPGGDGPRFCSDGTPVGGCSSLTKLHCDVTQQLVLKYETCGCPVGSCAAGKCSAKLAATADSYTYREGTAEGTNFGTASELRLLRYGTGPWQEAHVYIDCSDVQKIPSTAIVESAHLKVAAKDWGGRPVDLLLEIISQPWGEKSIAFANAPAVLKNGPQVPHTLDLVKTDITVTSLIAAWLLLPAVPHGLRLLTVPTTRQEPPYCKTDAGPCGYSVTLHSRETGATGPQLEVVYH